MKKSLYLDNASTSNIRPEVIKAMQPYFSDEYGNPSSLHQYGAKTRQIIEKSRQFVAGVLSCLPKEIIFTSGGTESVNLAIFGVARQHALHNKPGHIIVSAIEHEAVLESIKALAQEGWKVDYLGVDSTGMVSASEIKKLVRKDTVLVSVMYANNETGAIQPITEIGKILVGLNKVRLQKKLPQIVFHTDACQAGELLDLNIHNLKVDLLTLNGSKIEGPRGSGILFKKNSIQIRPLIFGGGQEQGLRSGTENTAAIVGFATALQLAQTQRAKHAQKLFTLQKHLERKLAKEISGCKINGPKNSSFKSGEVNFGLAKLPATSNISIKGVEGEALMYYLDAAGFAVATGSACTTSSTQASHVLTAMGINEKLAKSTIRLSLSYSITIQQLNKFISVLSKTVDLLKKTTQEL